MADLSPNAISVPASPQAPVVPATGTPAYYQTDFSEYSTGSPPSDFTERWNSAWGSTDVQSGGDYGGKVLYLYLAGNYEWTNEWNDVPDPQEVDVLIRGRLNTNVDNAPCIVVRGSGAVNAENGYEAAFRLASDQVRIYKLSGGTVSILSSASKTLNTSTWYWMRFRAYGKTLKVKAWSGNPDDEPSTWDIEIEDTSFLGTGFCGVGAHVGTGLNNCYCDYYSVATYGGTARWPPLYMGALTSPGTVNTPKVKFKYTVQPGAISQGIAVNAPAEFDLRIKPAPATSAVTVNAPAEFDLRIKPAAASSSVVLQPPIASQPGGEQFLVPATAIITDVTVNAPSQIDTKIKGKATTFPITQGQPKLRRYIKPAVVISDGQPKALNASLTFRPNSISIAKTVNGPRIARILQPICIFVCVNPTRDNDEFTGTDNDPLDASRWYSWQTSTANLPYISSNKARCDAGASATGYCGATTRYVVSGNFDTEIRINPGESYNATWHAGYLRFEIDSTHWIQVEFYRGFNDLKWRTRYQDGGSIQTPDTDSRSADNGYLRLTRTGSTIQTYYDDGAKSAWTELNAGGYALSSADGVIKFGVDRSTTATVNDYYFDSFFYSSLQAPSLPSVLQPSLVTSSVTVNAPTDLDLKIKAGSASSAVIQQDPKLRRYIGPTSAIAITKTVNAPAQFDLRIKSGSVSSLITVNAPTDLDLKIKATTASSVVTLPIHTVSQGAAEQFLVQNAALAITKTVNAPAQFDLKIKAGSASSAVIQSDPKLRRYIEPAAVISDGDPQELKTRTTIRPDAALSAQALAAPRINPRIRPDSTIADGATQAPTLEKLPVYLFPATVSSAIILPESRLRVFLQTVCIGQAVSQPIPHAQLMTLQPAAISQPAILPTPIVSKALEVAALVQPAAQAKPKLKTRIKTALLTSDGMISVQRARLILSAQTVQSVSQIPVPSLYSHIQIEANAVTSVGSVQVPEAQFRIRADGISVPVSQPSPAARFGIRPGTILEAVTQAVPALHQTIRPSCVVSPVTIAEPRVRMYLQADKIEQAVAVQTPAIHLRLRVFSLERQVQNPRPVAQHLGADQFLYPNQLFVWTPISPPSANVTISVNALSQPLAVAGPKLRTRIKTSQIIGAITQPKPTTYTDWIPATILTPAVVQEPRFRLTVKPSAIDVAAQVPVEEVNVEQFLQPVTVQTEVAPNASQIHLRIRPASTVSDGTQIAPTLALYLAPSATISDGTVKQPRIGQYVQASVIDTPVQVPVQEARVVLRPVAILQDVDVQAPQFDLTIKANAVVAQVVQPQPNVRKDLQILYPEFKEAFVMQFDPKVQPFHTFRDVQVSAAWINDYRITTQYVYHTRM